MSEPTAPGSEAFAGDTRAVGERRTRLGLTALFLANDGIDLSPYVDAFVKGMLRGFLIAWPVWIVLGVLVVGALTVGTYRRIVRARSRSRWR